MASDKQTPANRRNAQDSTGPTSSKDKAISSRNTLKTGIDITSELTRLESKPDLDQLETEYYEDFTPANAIERALVDQLIRNEWLLRRYAAIESSVWNFKLRLSKDEDPGMVFSYASETFLQLDRIRSSAQRNYNKALKELKALRKERDAAIPVREPAQQPAQPATTEPDNPELDSSHIFPEPPAPQPQPPVEIDHPDEEDPPLAA